jgi:hypothetical protein
VKHIIEDENSNTSSEVAETINELILREKYIHPNEHSEIDGTISQQDNSLSCQTDSFRV